MKMTTPITKECSPVLQKARGFLCILGLLSPVVIAAPAADLPMQWTVFVPVDTTAIDIAAITKIPASLPGFTREGTSVKVPPQRVTLVDDAINFAQLGIGVKEKRAGLAFAVITSPDTRTLKVGASADWWMEWFVNGKSVFSTMRDDGNGTGEMSPYVHQFDLPLVKGDNLVCVVVKSGSNLFKLWAGGSAYFARREAQINKLIDDANKRIPDIRRGAIVIKARPGTKITVRQQSHEFMFGTALSDGMLDTSNHKPDAVKYRDTMKTYFNAAVCEGSTKWPSVEREGPTPNYSRPDRSFAWCKDNGVITRGHCIFYGGYDDNSPAWARALNDSLLRLTALRHAEDITRHFRGQVQDWDLNNEMLHSDYFQRRLGPGIIYEMAMAAKKGNPDAVLYVNEYDVPTGAEYDGYVGRYISHIKKFIDQGVPIGGVGCQCHYTEDIPLERAVIGFTKLAELGLPITITEFDIGAKDEHKRARLLDAFYRISFGQPSINGILMWGFWGRKWVKDSQLWNTDWSVTEAGKAYTHLVKKEWWTDTTVVADRKGNCNVKAYYGAYTISSVDKTIPATLKKDDKQVVVDLQ